MRTPHAVDVASERVAIEIFDKITAFVLDILFFSTIIYIWYEDSELRLSLVRLSTSSVSPFGVTATVANVPKVPKRRTPT
jgi:hypothetical protein